MPRGWLWLVFLLIILAAPTRGASDPLEEAIALNQQVEKLSHADRYQEALSLAQPAAGIRGYPATLKISHDFLVEKTFRDELFRAECFPRVSSLRS
jgi:hypothetical protein